MLWPARPHENPVPTARRRRSPISKSSVRDSAKTRSSEGRTTHSGLPPTLQPFDTIAKSRTPGSNGNAAGRGPDGDSFGSAINTCHKHWCKGRSASPGKRVDDVCKDKIMPPAERLERAVVSTLRQVLRGTEILSMAAAQANEQAAARMEPLRRDLAQKQRDFAKVIREGKEVYDRVRMEGMQDIPWAREDLDRLTRERGDLAAGVRFIEEAITVEENKRIDLACVEEALADLDRLWPNLTGPEAKELIGLLVREVRVHAGGTMEIDLYEGRALRAAMPAKSKPRGGGVNQPDTGFVSGADWLRRRDSNSRPGG